ncbi:heme ABC exporter ATP-binding protein CcmA [Roseovarius sp. SCSIO 43702]|uniref:heme ABC exporter ATP-binding protein CcmA n=1 Tax=Roseovarius sp. SCSIO 43702 TaxID=2823043 RepID=UPI001C72FFB7|nr:heme ABC exporter ATP-binding protein CcmA [Roseovarius sp. SCSIO 43702]QYX57902.1 heme ABC exporter ATP-binding protein CcmA [Roseovarius sp. SCSIO 43702]
MPVEPLLSARSLRVARGGVDVLEGVDLNVAPGEAVILRGPNGVGKTTLLRVLAGIQPPRAGAIVRAPDCAVLAGHKDGVKPTLSVAENLGFWAQVFGGRDISRALGAFDLAALRDRLAGTLSAGQTRRLGLARLLVAGRKLWLLDEPTVSLDTRAVAMFADAVRAHLAGGGAAVIATHIELGLAEAREMELEPFRARIPVPDDPDEAFL